MIQWDQKLFVFHHYYQCSELTLVFSGKTVLYIGMMAEPGTFPSIHSLYHLIFHLNLHFLNYHEESINIPWLISFLLPHFFVFSRGFLIASLSIKFWIINSVLLFLLSCLWLFSWWCCSFKWELNPPWFFIRLVYWHWFIRCIGYVLIWHRSLGYSLCSVSLSLGSMFIL